jgi:putative chitinase
MNLLNLPVPLSIKEELPFVMKTFGINTELRLAHFLAQCAHESGNFRMFTENLNYSEQGLLNIFKKYFTPAQAKQYARKPVAIGSRVYANRMGNGNEESKDGFNYRGRGCIQLTGKSNYAAFSKFVPDNVVISPDLVSTKYPLSSAGWFWSINNINALADKDDIISVTKRINGGTNGIEDRKKYLAIYKKHFNIN